QTGEVIAWHCVWLSVTFGDGLEQMRRREVVTCVLWEFAWDWTRPVDLDIHLGFRWVDEVDGERHGNCKSVCPLSLFGADGLRCQAAILQAYNDGYLWRQVYPDECLLCFPSGMDRVECYPYYGTVHAAI